MYLKTNIELEEFLGINFYSTTTKGIGGKIKKKMEDFFVEEDSVIEEDQEGSHLLVKIEKRGVTTQEVVEKLSRELNIPKKNIGAAGIKDKWAVAVQKFTVPYRKDLELEKIEENKLRVLDMYRVKRKLKPGMLKGNWFRIFVRDITICEDMVEDLISETIKQLNELGCPNYFGYQRFGVIRPNTHLLGKHLVNREYGEFIHELVYKRYPLEDPRTREAREKAEKRKYREALRKIPPNFSVERKIILNLSKGVGEKESVHRLGPRFLKFCINAWQSYLFNLMLSERMRRGLSLKEFIDGDLVKAGEPAFPLIGFKSKIPCGEAGEIVSVVLERENVEREMFKFRERKLSVRGSLRKTCLKYREIKYIPGSKNILFTFWLEKSCYASILLREFCKNDFFILARS